MSQSNNPPAAVLELTKEEADFLMANADVSVQQGLGLLLANQQGGLHTDRAKLEQVVGMMELQRSIMKKLEKQGIAKP